MEEHVLLIAMCWNCGRTVLACPNCVTSIPIDPHTGLPPEVRRTDDGGYVHQEADPAARARSIREPLCDGCARLNGTHIETWEQRHRRHCSSF
ncbi:hypothetical protein AB0N05_37850 [Nocardia sp. NPDC051030]|uniref:hypothetical protein n=1 Tax=Nocardia sp. NPDC051030 TaxID=3155162 RepID=UPI0034167734